MTLNINDIVQIRPWGTIVIGNSILCDGKTYGDSAKWSYNNKKLEGTPSTIASIVSDEVYLKTPMIHNEMINRTVLSTQGSAAKRKLLEEMISNINKARFGIQGYGPERAVYEAIFIKNKIHVANSNLEWDLLPPRKG